MQNAGDSQGINFVVLISSQSVWETRETSKVSTSRDSNLLCWCPPKAWKSQEERQIRALPGNQLCCPDTPPKHVIHKRHVRCGHSPGIEFVVLKSSLSVWNTRETSDAGAHRESTLLSWYVSMYENTTETWNAGTHRESNSLCWYSPKAWKT